MRINFNNEDRRDGNLNWKNIQKYQKLAIGVVASFTWASCAIPGSESIQTIPREHPTDAPTLSIPEKVTPVAKVKSKISNKIRKEIRRISKALKSVDEATREKAGLDAQIFVQKEKEIVQEQLDDPEIRTLVSGLIKRVQNDESQHVRAASALALGLMKERSAVPALISTLDDVNYRHAGWVIGLALGISGVNDQELTMVMNKFVKGEHAHERASAAAALGYIGNIKALPLLVEAAQQTDKQNEMVVNRSIYDGLSCFFEIPVLTKALTNKNNSIQIRKSAAVAMKMFFRGAVRIGNFGAFDVTPHHKDHPEGARIAYKVLWDANEDPEVRKAAGEALDAYIEWNPPLIYNKEKSPPVVYDLRKRPQ